MEVESRPVKPYAMGSALQRKLILTLRVIGRRTDGYHEVGSLVGFAGLFDWLAFEPGDDLILEVLGPRANEAGPIHENLVLRAARSLAAHMPGLRLGQFRLIKRLPIAAGLGGGSADAAAALRLLADEAGLRVDDPRVRALLLRRRDAMSWYVFLPKPASSGALATNSVRRFGCQIFLPFWSTNKFKAPTPDNPPCLTLPSVSTIESSPRSLPIAVSGATAI